MPDENACKLYAVLSSMAVVSTTQEGHLTLDITTEYTLI